MFTLRYSTFTLFFHIKARVTKSTKISIVSLIIFASVITSPHEVVRKLIKCLIAPMTKHSCCSWQWIITFITMRNRLYTFKLTIFSEFIVLLPLCNILYSIRLMHFPKILFPLQTNLFLDVNFLRDFFFLLCNRIYKIRNF